MFTWKINHWIVPLGQFSVQVAMSVCLCVCVCAIGCSFFRPLIGPEITWSVPRPLIGNLVCLYNGFLRLITAYWELGMLITASHSQRIRSHIYGLWSWWWRRSPGAWYLSSRPRGAIGGSSVEDLQRKGSRWIGEPCGPQSGINLNMTGMYTNAIVVSLLDASQYCLDAALEFILVAECNFTSHFLK